MLQEQFFYNVIDLGWRVLIKKKTEKTFDLINKTKFNQ